MKRLFKWLVINGLFMAFFVFGSMLPPAMFSGIYFLLWIVLVVVFIILLFSVIGYQFGDMTISDLKVNQDKFRNRNKALTLIDIAYDIVMVVILGGLGFYVFGVLYAFTMLLQKLFVAQLVKAVHEYDLELNRIDSV